MLKVYAASSTPFFSGNADLCGEDELRLDWDLFSRAAALISAERRERVLRRLQRGDGASDFVGYTFVRAAKAAESLAAELLLVNALLCDFGFYGSAEFAYGERGKPYLVTPEGVWFSISHSDRWAVCAISDEGEVGVDIQKIVPARTQIAERYFNAEQNARLRALPEGAEQNRLFTELWARREASIKARGGSVLERGSDGAQATLIEAPSGFVIALC